MNVTVPRWTRRRFLALAAAAGAGTVGAHRAGAQTSDRQPGPSSASPPTTAGTTDGDTDLATAVTAALRPSIRPRSDWATEAPKGPLDVEAAGDVRFLLVHHSASANGYAAGAVPAFLRQFYALHTSREKGWPDVAYNFFVDQHGAIWEGRQGSIDAPVKGDATGGSQGFALLCCLVGNHQEAPLTSAQQDSLVRLLAWLGARYGIDTTPGASTSFVSRGSNRWRAGATVTTGTIAGHRDMSTTVCPGDLAYRLIPAELPTAVTALRQAASQAVLATTTTTTTTPTTSTTSTTTPTSRATPRPSADSAPVRGQAGSPLDVADDGSSPAPFLVGGVGAALAAGLLYLRDRVRRN